MRVTLPAVPTPVVIGVDAGPTRVRAVAVDESARLVASSSRELAQYEPRPGWVEQDPEEIWDAVQAALAELAGAASTIAGIGLAAQRDTVVAWDRRSGEALHPAITRRDRRAADRIDRLESTGHQQRIDEISGLVLDPTFSGPKMAWLLADGGVRAGPRLALGTLDAWLLWKLTEGGLLATDPSSASRTLLYDIRYGTWSTELCDLLRVPTGALPELRKSSGRLGTTSAGVPVSALIGDEQAALFGQACVRPGMAKTTYGRGSVVLLNVGEERPAPADGLLATVAWALPGAAPVFALEGSIAATGAAIDWLCDGLGVVETPADIGPLAESVRDAQGVAYVPAFSGLASPWDDPRARGTIVGLTRGSGRAQLARAAVEAMAYQTRDVLDAMTAAAGRPLVELRVDGGASVLDLLLQIQADQLRVPVVRPEMTGPGGRSDGQLAGRPSPDGGPVTETAAVGAALLAGLGEGVWSSVDEVAGLWRQDAAFQPRAPQSVADDRFATWHRAVERSRRWSRNA